MGRRRPLQTRADQHEGHLPDPLTRPIAAHDAIVVAVGPSIRLLDCSTEPPTSHIMAQENGHVGAVRCVTMSVDGHYLLSGSDDKCCKLWDLRSRRCLATWRMLKKLSACAFTADSRFVLMGDKFGDVAVAAVPASQPASDPAALPAQAGPADMAAMQPDLLLGHLGSSITSLAVSPDNRLVASTDKEGRVRLSILPPADQLLKGAYEIQAFGFGHTSFVTSAAFISAAVPAGSSVQPSADQTSSSDALLVTSSGDGTVRLWQPMTGRLLHSYVAATPSAQPANACASTAVAADGDGQQSAVQVSPADAGAAELLAGQAPNDTGDHKDGADEGAQDEDDEGEGEEDGKAAAQQAGPSCAAVHHVSCSPDGLWVCVVVEGAQEMQLLRMDWSTQQLALAHTLQLPGLRCPCASSWDKQGRCWVVGGPLGGASMSLHLGVFSMTAEGQLSVDPVVPVEVLAAIEQRAASEEAALEAALAAGPLDVKWTAALHKRTYEDYEQQEHIKKRKDTKEHERLVAVRGAGSG